MFRQKKTNRRRGSFATTISVVVCGMALLFLFNHQALAIIICCASEQIQTTPSCHQQMEGRGKDQNTAGSGSHHLALQTEEKESIATSAAEWKRPLPQCCQTAVPIESEPPPASVSKEVLPGAVVAITPTTVSSTKLHITSYSPTDHGSPPVYLLTSRLII